MERQRDKFYNYIKLHDLIKNRNPLIAYFVEAFAFRQVYEGISSQKLLPENYPDLATLYANYKQEGSINNFDESKVTKELYFNFIEDFYKGYSFDSIEFTYLARDLLEIMTIFGPFDDITTKRRNIAFNSLIVEFFNKKIASLKRKKSAIELSKKYSLPITPNDSDYLSYQNEIIKLIESSNQDIENGNSDQSIKKIEAAIKFLSNIV